MFKLKNLFYIKSLNELKKFKFRNQKNLIDPIENELEVNENNSDASVKGEINPSLLSSVNIKKEIDKENQIIKATKSNGLDNSSLAEINTKLHKNSSKKKCLIC